MAVFPSSFLKYSTDKLWSFTSALFCMCRLKAFSSSVLYAGSLLSFDDFAPRRRIIHLPAVCVCTKCQLCFTSPHLCCFYLGFTLSLPCQDGSGDRNTNQSLLEGPPHFMVKITHLSFLHTIKLYIVLVHLSSKLC